MPTSFQYCAYCANKEWTEIVDTAVSEGRLHVPKLLLGQVSHKGADGIRITFPTQNAALSDRPEHSTRSKDYVFTVYLGSYVVGTHVVEAFMVALQHEFDQRMLAVKYDGVFCVVIGDSEAAKSAL